MYDVIIVGAGPGGSHSAKVLAKAGYDVIILEKDKLPRDKPCAGWITPSVIELTDLSITKLNYFAPMHGTVLWLPEKDSFTPYPVRYQKPVSYGIQRSEFDMLLTNEARNAGAEVLDGTFVTNVYRQKKAVFVQAKDNQEFKGRFVIGADGTHSRVASDLWLRRKWNPAELIQCIVSETEIGDKTSELTDYYGFPEVFFNFRAAGYSWFYTKGSLLNVGLGLQLSKVSPNLNTKTLWQELLQSLEKINHLQGVKLAPIKAHTYPSISGPYHYPTYGDRVLLIGDAGGFPITYTGEGIRTAIQTGNFAAETLIDALQHDHKDLKAYKEKWNKALRSEYITGDILRMFFTPSYYELIKSLFVEEKRFRKLFFDLFFNRLSPQQAIRRFLLYTPLLSYRFFRFGILSLLKDLRDFLNV